MNDVDVDRTEFFAKNFIFIFTFFLVFVSVAMQKIPVVAAISENATKIQDDLALAEKDMQQMMAANFHVTRYNDTLQAAKQMFENQFALEGNISKADYGPVFEKIDELKNIKELSYKAFDELDILNLTINQTQDVNMTDANTIYEQAKEAFVTERYEDCLNLVEKTYEKISELEAFSTKAKAFYEATSKTVVGFIGENWIVISVLLLASVSAFVLGYNRVMSWLAERKIEELEMRKVSIRSLIKKSQKEYFDEGKMSESTYYVRIKKFGEIIRDLNRQIPLLKEELAIRKKRKI